MMGNKILFILLLIASTSNLSKAEGILINPREKSVEGKNDGSKIASSVITNNSTNLSDSIFRWTIISYNIAGGWEFTFCDNKGCYLNLEVGSSETFTLRNGESGPLKGEFIYNLAGGTGNVQVVVTCTTNPLLTDTFTMIAKSWATGLNDLTSGNEPQCYPNPAKDNLVLKYQVNKPVEVTIYNVLGSKVSSFIHQGTETTINTSSLQKGMYFIRFSDNGRLISKPFYVTEY